MFGLMRAKTCGMSAEEKTARRLNYCGTCKTIGLLYGQKSRLLLNHDAVFLAEILTALSGENTSDWNKSYQSYNCLNLPRAEMPVVLQYAATTNVILTAFKLDDQIADEKKRRFHLAQKAFSGEFQKAESLLRKWDFPFDRVKEILQTQIGREAVAGEKLSLDYLAEPTAQATAEFFAFGAELIGKDEFKKQFREIGFAFGKLIYILDALEDYEKDFRRNNFNALRRVFQFEENKLSPEIKRKTAALLRGLEWEISSRIHALSPLAENQKRLFALRLQSNLQKKLKPELPVLKAKHVCRQPKINPTWAQRRRDASEKARALARDYSWQMPLVFLFVFAFALAAPAQTREARSARECFDLGFNLMFLGAIFGSALAFPKMILMENPEELLTKAGRKKKAREAMAKQNQGTGDDGDGWCDSCDCCCDCDGCDCCCDNCDCCSGCCDNCCCDCSCD